MPQLPEDSAKQMTVSRLEKASRIWSYIRLARSCHFPPVLPSLYPRAAPNLEVLSGYREEVLRKILSFWSKEQEKKDKGQWRKLFCVFLPSPLPWDKYRKYSSGGCCKKSTAVLSKQAPRNWERETPLQRRRDPRACSNLSLSSHCLMWIHQENTIPIANLLNNSVTKYMRQKLTDMKGKINNSSIIIKRLHHVLQGQNRRLECHCQLTGTKEYLQNTPTNNRIYILLNYRTFIKTDHLLDHWGKRLGNSMVVQWLILGTFTDCGSIPGWGTKIHKPHSPPPKKEKN